MMKCNLNLTAPFLRSFFSLILYSNVCQSYIGKKGGKQLLSLGGGCKNRGHVTHELMHALGFFHEHTRPDRNKFVKILWNNIKNGNSCLLSKLLTVDWIWCMDFPLKNGFLTTFQVYRMSKAWGNIFYTNTNENNNDVYKASGCNWQVNM